MNKIKPKKMAVAMVLFILVMSIILGTLIYKKAFAASACYWLGTTSTSWNNAANWSSSSGGTASTCAAVGGVPTVGDTANFTSGGNNPASINTAASIAALNINAGYTSTITIAAANSLTLSGTFTIHDGTFSSNGQNLTINSYTQDGGIFNSGASLITIVGNFTHTVATGTFNEDTGTVSFNNNIGGGDRSINVNTTEAFNNVAFAGTNSSYGYTISTGDDIVVNGTLTLTNGLINGPGIVNANGATITQAATFDGGSARLNFSNDALVQTYTIAGGSVGPYLYLDSADDASDSVVFSAAAALYGLNITSGFSGTVPITDNSNNITLGSASTSAGGFTLDANVTFDNQVVYIGTFSQSNGTFNATPGTLVISWNFTKSGGTFNAGPGTVSFNNGAGGGDRTIDVATTEAFNNVTFNSVSNTYGYAIATGDNIVVNGTLTLTNGVINGPGIVDESGATITQDAGFDGGSARLNFADADLVQTYTIAGGSTGPYLYLDHAADANDSVIFSGAATLYGLNITSGFSGTVPITDNGNNISLGAGGFTLDANVTFSNQLVSTTYFNQSAGTFTAISGTLAITNSFTKSGGTFNEGTGTVNFNNTVGNPDRIIDVIGTEVFYNVIFNSGWDLYGHAIATGDTIQVNGTLTLTNGPLNGPGKIDAKGDVIDVGTFDGGTSPLTLSGTGNQTYSIAGIPMTGVLALNKDTGITTLSNSSSTLVTLTLSSAAQKSGGLAVNTSGSGGLTLVGATNNPNVTLTGGLSFGKTSSGVPAITMGTATAWSVSGDVNFTNATLTQGTSTLTLNGSAAQTFTAGGTGAGHTPYNLVVTNSSGPSNGVTFADSLTLAAGGTFTDTTGDSKLTFADGATFTFPIIAINGAIGHTINMTKGAGANGHWFFNVAAASPTVTYVAVDHSDATGSSGAINDTVGGVNNLNNINWNFPTTVPDAPTIGTATAGAGAGQATITFTPGSDGGSAITGYTVTSTPSSITGTGAGSPITVSGLANGTGYTFTVHATNAIGNSAESAASNSITTFAVPGAPTIGIATPGNTQASVTFSAPGSDGGTSITGYTVTSTPGSLTDTGAGSPITVNGLTNGTAYTFTVHATNTIGNGPESAASSSVTPTSGTQPTTEPETPRESLTDAGQIKKSPIVATETAPATDNKKSDIVWEDFSFYAVLRSGNVRINVSHEGKFEVVNNTNVLVEIPTDIFAKKVNIITLSTSDSTYLMNLLSAKNKYQAVIPMPAVKGDFELKILIVYEDGTIKEIKKNISVDPQGYVYTMSSNYFGLGKKQEVRIADAKVTLYQVVDGKSKVWDSGGKQPNPVMTNKSGEYAFWVEPGDYYLLAEKVGYKTAKTDTMNVENALVIKNIPIELKFKPWIWLILVGIVIVAIIFAVRRKKKDNNRIN